MNIREEQVGKHRYRRKRVLESFRSKDTITAVDPEVYDSIVDIKIRWTMIPYQLFHL